jgi:hypothetical protein
LDEADPEETVLCGGLLGGITAYHLRLLCESPWEGGGGYMPEQVARMTPDQVWFRLCKLDVLKNAPSRTEKRELPEEIPGGDGMLVRMSDGTLKRLPVIKASELAEKGRRKRRRKGG